MSLSRSTYFAAATIIEGMRYDWTKTRSKTLAVRTLCDTLGISKATAYRMLSDWMDAKHAISRAANPGFWLYGTPA